MAVLLLLGFAFCLGAAIGSFVNVVAARLPYEKSLVWPGSRCPRCVQPIAWYDNVPLLGYLLLGGRCRTCRGPIPLRYFLVELFAGCAFSGIVYLELFQNTLGLPLLAVTPTRPLSVPPEALLITLHHLVLFSFLLAASQCDLQELEVPIGVTIPGTLVGLVLSTLLAWPTPCPLPAVMPAMLPPAGGAQPWPVWYPLPEWLPPGSWQLGLATGLVGALTGMVLLRTVAFLFYVGRGIEGLGIGDADLMMMVGAFVGWQPVVLSFFVAVFPALVFALIQLARRGDHPLPFVPALAMGSMITILFWPNIGGPFALLLFDATLVGALAGGGAVILLVVSFLLRLGRGGVAKT